MVDLWLPPGDGWIEFSGGECPVNPNDVVQWVTTHERKTKTWDGIKAPARDLFWRRYCDGEMGIVAYRVCKKGSR